MFGNMLHGYAITHPEKLFAEKYGADPKIMQDIGMENKGLEYSQYVSKESLAQQGGYAMTNKGPQHDEAWLIFMDMVNNQIPTFEKKAEEQDSRQYLMTQIVHYSSLSES